MTKSINKEILFYYESRQNPNGDPGFENQPRLMPDDTILITDVRIKRTIRDYARDVLGETLFVDYDKDGNAVTADQRAKEIIGNMKGKDVIGELIQSTFDAPLFGALVTVRSEKGDDEGGSYKLTGPAQFGLGRSVNKVRIINPTISGRFVGKEKENQEKQFSTFGKFYSVEYALLKIHGAINPMNLGKYFNNDKARNRFDKVEEKLFECLWKGTNNLITRSKFPQRSILYIEVSYDSTSYNDLPVLVDESQEMKQHAKELSKSPFDFRRLVSALVERKSRVKNVRIASCDDIQEDVRSLASQLRSKGIPVQEL
ncbi:type I CRISPR-associated protein Cas7 [Nitrososphaera viennensis]|uniref:Type I CRISPR-associated protein Cas7 n=2 Tax=Nitrososphaera viennensis TaxID=1034015 RepID=A0A977IBV9_9ARCH|nr:type I CRISPR-associated protein Cas7 [Nitrososphaera viennensis]AIC15997.1 putative CPISPR-associated protein Cas7 [Nitrososphaera viennensis EN76]UVS67972.1 type I CRISPR-associated protein Cas7 [Nitrososphaera viennensis]